MVILQATEMLRQLLFVCAFSGTVGAGGVYFGYKGVKTGGNWWMFRQANSKTGGDAIEDGDQPVTVHGTVKPDGEPLLSPLTGEKCVAYEYKIQVTDNERPHNNGVEDHDHDYYHDYDYDQVQVDDDGWTTVDEGSDEPRFAIETDKSRVRVDSSDADLTLAQEVESETQIQQESPEALRESPSIDLGSLTLTGDQQYRYIENEIEIGEPGSALGKVVSARGDADYRLTQTDSNKFVVSDAEPQTTQQRLLRDSLKNSLIGLLASSVALGGLALFLVSVS